MSTKTHSGGCRGFRWLVVGMLALIFFLPAAIRSMDHVGAWMWSSEPPRYLSGELVCVEIEPEPTASPLSYGFDGEAVVVSWLDDSLAFAGLSEAQQVRVQQRWQQAMRNFDLGRLGRAARQFSELAASLPTCTMRTGCYYNAACAHARLGESVPAMLNLAQAMRGGFRDASVIERDPDLDALRDEPLYQHLIELCNDQRFDELDQLDLAELRTHIRD